MVLNITEMAKPFLKEGWFIVFTASPTYSASAKGHFSNRKKYKFQILAIQNCNCFFFRPGDVCFLPRWWSSWIPMLNKKMKTTNLIHRLFGSWFCRSFPLGFSGKLIQVVVLTCKLKQEVAVITRKVNLTSNNQSTEMNLPIPLRQQIYVQ